MPQLINEMNPERLKKPQKLQTNMMMMILLRQMITKKTKCLMTFQMMFWLNAKAIPMANLTNG